MSDRGPALPPAAIDISDTRAVVERAAELQRKHEARSPFAAVIGSLVLAALAFAVGLSLDSLRAGIVSAVIALLLSFAFLFVLPRQLATRRRREAVEAAAGAIDTGTDRLIARLAGIGYVIPEEVALDWVTSQVPSATVPLVHDSVIAARVWRPAEDDERIFVEPYLKQEGVDAMLPALRPLG